MKALIEAHGGRNLAAVSGNVDYIVAGEKMGPAKLKKAEKLGIRIIDEEEFFRMIEEAGPANAPADTALQFPAAGAADAPADATRQAPTNGAADAAPEGTETPIEGDAAPEGTETTSEPEVAPVQEAKEPAAAPETAAPEAVAGKAAAGKPGKAADKRVTEATDQTLF